MNTIKKHNNYNISLLTVKYKITPYALKEDLFYLLCIQNHHLLHNGLSSFAILQLVCSAVIKKEKLITEKLKSSTLTLVCHSLVSLLLINQGFCCTTLSLLKDTYRPGIWVCTDMWCKKSMCNGGCWVLGKVHLT